MIELDLETLSRVLLEQLKILAAIRRMAVEHELDSSWAEDWENTVAALIKEVRVIRATKGDVLTLSG